MFLIEVSIECLASQVYVQKRMKSRRIFSTDFEILPLKVKRLLRVLIKLSPICINLIKENIIISIKQINTTN